MDTDDDDEDGDYDDDDGDDDDDDDDDDLLSLMQHADTSIQKAVPWLCRTDVINGRARMVAATSGPEDSWANARARVVAGRGRNGTGSRLLFVHWLFFYRVGLCCVYVFMFKFSLVVVMYCIVRCLLLLVSFLYV